MARTYYSSFAPPKRSCREPARTPECRNTEPGYRSPYFYRASKIALNMVMRVLADDLRARGVIVALVAPYPTDTDMLRELIGPEAAARRARPEDSVAGMIRVIDGLTLENSTTPRFADGRPISW
jgi:NAD(P)-dependent dehydrogenase (short-subunit alcohol dehydrogenase family)